MFTFPERHSCSNVQYSFLKKPAFVTAHNNAESPPVFVLVQNLV